jgi:hypothetical protein
MRLLIHAIDWEYPTEQEDYAPELWDLSSKHALMGLYLEFANGVILELRAEAETWEGIELIRGLATGAGSCTQVELTTAEKAKLWLYHEGDICFKQGADAYIFLAPQPVPYKFP